MLDSPNEKHIHATAKTQMQMNEIKMFIKNHKPLVGTLKRNKKRQQQTSYIHDRITYMRIEKKMQWCVVACLILDVAANQTFFFAYIFIFSRYGIFFY